MRFTVLGSGTLIPDDGRRSAAHLVSGQGYAVLLDCGSGTVHGFQRHGVAWARLTHLAITHFHTDHVGDVPALMWAMTHGRNEGRDTPLYVLGPPGIQAFMEGLAGVFGAFVLEPGFDVRIVELARRDSWNDPRGRFRLETHPTIHTERSLAYRIHGKAGSVGYTGDTGPDPELYRFMAGADLVVAECSNPDPPVMDTHLTPSGLAELGRVAEPGLLVATHVYAPLTPAEVPERVRDAGYHGAVAAGTDGLEIEVGARPDPT